MKYIILLTLVIMGALIVGCSYKKILDVEEETLTETNESSTILVQNEKITGDSLYSFDLLNIGDSDKECWVILEVTSDGELIETKKEYRGIVKSGKTISSSIKINKMPAGLSRLEIIPDCK